MGPKGLGTDLVAVMLVGAATWCALRATVATAWGVRTGRDVDVVHALMGVSMAGTLVGWASGAWDGVWAGVFVAATLWFAWGFGRELKGRRCAHGGQSHLPHLAMSVVMLYMLVSMRWAGMGSMGHGVGTGASSGGVSYLALGVAVLLVGNASLAAFQALQGSRALAAVGVGALGEPTAPGSAAISTDDAMMAPRRSPDAMLAPRGTALCLVAMSLAMAYMLVAMRPG